ncbi:hypothetical protein ACFQZE_07260 [Paenibacillus sp. GCM10027627]|uniref:hypothetical protein n=1 Tax=unclassified Paenibacillus TaxID=185978 RepID=UPI00362F5A11
MIYRKHKEYVGEKFGKLEILEYQFKDKKGYFLVKCECSENEKWVRSDGILSSGQKSCGCEKGSRTHGMTNTRLFTIWNGMKTRCNDKDDADYGGRGITVFEQWKNDFMTFYEWATNNGYSDYLTLDRVDVNGNYEPDNCRWTTRIAQSNNTRSNYNITINGETKTVSEWSRISGISRPQIKNRFKSGVPEDEILKPTNKAVNQSGVKGVKWDKYKQRWKAEHRVKGNKVIHIGYFKEVDDAISAKAKYHQS